MVGLSGASLGPRGRDWKWSDARARMALLAEPARTGFAGLFAQVERLEPAVRGLEDAVAAVQADGCPPSLEPLLTFAAEDVVDLFHTTRLTVAALVPGRPSWLEEADPVEADAHASLLARYARVLASARPDGGWPDALAPAVARVGMDVEEWYEGFRARLDVLEDSVFRVLRSTADAARGRDEPPVAVRNRMEN